MRLDWNRPGSRTYETGVDRGVLFPRSGPGVAWPGLVSVTENVKGGDVEPVYYDGVKIADVVKSEDFEANIEAFDAPYEFLECDGSRALAPGLYVGQQRRRTFGFSYRTLVGNDLEAEDYGHKLHIVYNATAQPTTKANKTLSNSATLDTRSWTCSTVPPQATTYRPTAHFVIDSTRADPYLLEEVETILYGRDDRDPRLPSQSEIIALFAARLTDTIEATI